jgi:hypothetical protein
VLECCHCRELAILAHVTLSKIPIIPTPVSSNYDGAIHDLEAEAKELERQAQDIQRELEKVRSVLAGLRDIACHSRLTSAITDSPYRAPLVLEPQGEQPPSQRGDIPNLVIAVLRDQPGMRSSALADLLKGRITTNARNPRKLVLNAVSYLASKHRIQRDATSGGWVLPNDEGTQSASSEATAQQ